MGKVTAWQCVHCEALFPKKNLMENHRRKCAIETKERKAAEDRRLEAIEKANSFRLKLENLSEIPGVIEQVGKEHGRYLKVTKWELTRFRTDMAPTHNAPVGKPTEFMVNKDTPRYAGWEGKIEADSDLFTNRIPHDASSFREISSLADLIRAFVKGVNTGCSGVARNHYAQIRIYLDDFPKIKAKYERWKPEFEKSKEYKRISKELSNKAQVDMIANNEKMLELGDVQDILRARLKQIDKEREKIRQDVMTSKEFQDACKVPEKHHYNQDTLYELGHLFE